jgi:hypothetical protein
VKDVFIKQMSVLDRKLNSTSIDGLCLILKNYLNLQKNQISVYQRSPEIHHQNIHNEKCFDKTIASQ